MTRTATSTAPRATRWAAFVRADVDGGLLMGGVPSYVGKDEQPREPRPG